jgi:poly(3-hydroxybutyrate) depolymerase
MKQIQFPVMLFILAVVAAVGSAMPASIAQIAAGRTIDVSAKPGHNFDKADFRLWLPNDVEKIRAVAILVPGSNADGRVQVDEPIWREFAIRNKLALVACLFADRPHDQDFIEEYADVSRGSGEALLDALSELAARSHHPELASAPLLLWGMSAGGQYNYEFVAWKPERVVAFVVNKGGIYYSALVRRAARNVPGILFTGEKDLEFRTNTIAGLFAVNRRAGALWALAEEPGIAHAVGRSRDMAVIFFEDVLSLRLDPSLPGAKNETGLKPLDEKSGFIGDLKSKTYQPLGPQGAPNYPTAWLPTERAAQAWQALVTEKPFDR